MPFKEETLLAGLKVLGSKFRNINSVVGLQDALRFELPQYAGEERVVNRDIVGAIRDLAGQASDTVPMQRVGAGREYWHDVWVSLYLTEEELQRLEADQQAPVAEVARLFDYLKGGVEAYRGKILNFTDRSGLSRRIEIGHITGWQERVATRSLTLAVAVQAGTSPHDFSRFNEFFAPVPRKATKQLTIQDKRRLLDECMTLEQKYWDVLK